jgi:geranylgeranyl diphosphate synthase, type II
VHDGRPVRKPDDLRELVESYLGQITAFPGFDLSYGGLAEPIRYALEGGGKRIRPVLCLAVAEAAGAPPPIAAPAAAAVELVHTFSLVHDDLPALDDDDVRRGRPSVHVQFDEAVAVLTGDALLALAFELVTSYEPDLVKRLVHELASATGNMIRGQHMELAGEARDLESLHDLKTGGLFVSAAGCGLHVASIAAGDAQRPYRAFAREFGLLFQVVDDIADRDGAVETLGAEAAHGLRAELEGRARAALEEIDADTSVLAELLSGLSARISGR